MASLKKLTGHTIAQIERMTDAEFSEIFDKLEDNNQHTACAMLHCVKKGDQASVPAYIAALELLDDIHATLGHMPQSAQDLRFELAQWRRK